MFKLITLIVALVALSSCITTTTAAEPENRLSPKVVYIKSVSGIPIPFTNYTIGGLYKQTQTTFDAPPPQPSKVIARGKIINGLIVISGLAFLLVPVGIIAALYFKWGGGPVLSISGLITSFVAAGAAYWFDYIVWVVGVGFVALIGYVGYLAFNRGKLKTVIGELIETGEEMKYSEWTESTKLKLMRLQSRATAAEVVKSKNQRDREKQKAEHKEQAARRKTAAR